ncbi:MAG TPA: SgcJ/EcaC family oxidoreductase [Blastocatellia bacterium]|nr:SgcJ/EcaC family oxidoreductase [Blastocatellia bacterium]
MSKDADLRKDLEAIERLHQKDMAASKAGDFATLRSIMTDDAVIMPPGGKVVRGRAEMDAGFERMKESMSQVEVLEYVLDFEEAQVLGDYAFERGMIRGAMRSKDGGEVEHSTYKVMRILQKQPDGSWKVHRSIWNNNPANA